ncbi:MAG: CDGSH iron-sulfur domain-containing protein [Solirubrobacteraceae bacterium]
MGQDEQTARITATDSGPYKVAAGVELIDAAGNVVTKDGPAFLCRCGGSQNKPFCDGTHNSNGFDGTLTAATGPIAERRDAYEGDGITVYDDRGVCAHIGECTANLPEVWKLRTEPWIDPHGADRERIAEVVGLCPSGALAYARAGADEPVEEPLEPAIRASVDGPYHVRGAIPVTGADGTQFEPRNRQALCRCGGSKNKPFCDGTHWHIGFKDPR